ncbi:MAG: tetratricopeptide repeat protein [Candidatus Thorarchaeota archaeon]
MNEIIREKLTEAITLMYQAKFSEALEKIEKFEKEVEYSSRSQLLALLLKGKIHLHREEYKIAIDIGEQAYLLSQQLGCILESFEALILKSAVIYLGKVEEAHQIIIKADSIFEDIKAESDNNYPEQQAQIFLLKSIISHHRGDLNEAIDLANQCSLLTEKYGEKLDIARVYFHLAELQLFKTESEIGLKYGEKALALEKELNNNIGIATAYYLLGTCFYTKGEVDQALNYVKMGKAIKETGNLTKFNLLDLTAGIYIHKGKLDRALRNRIRAANIATEEDFNEQVIMSIYGIGVIYRMKGNFKEANQNFEQSLDLSKKYNSPYGMQTSLFYLTLTNLDNNSLENAKVYLNKLEEFAEKTESKVFNNVYIVAKALVLKNSGRIRNRTEAELLLKQIIESEFSTPPIYLLSIVNLCELFLEELFMTNNPEVLEDLVPLISQMVDFAEKQRSYLWLAEAKLLQAKLALIQMNIDEAKQILIQAQRVADLHGFSLLAVRISAEHDNLLERINIWDNLKKTNAPMSDRIRLASFNEPLERMQGKRALETTQPNPEVPVLLLIIGEGGFPLFSNPFKEKLIMEEDLVSAFLSAFNSFSGELFSKGLDRAKFGDHMILIQTVNSFSVCYLFKGQTYLARQKLNKFTEYIRSTSAIWQTLHKYYKTSRAIELKDLPPLESLITEIFVS